MPVANAAELLKRVGLLPDGPVRWGSPVRSGRPGVFIVELGEPLGHPPVDVAISGKWAERVPTLTLDGARPDGRALSRRLAAFWLPSQTVLYVGSTERSLGGRVGALYANELGSRRPHPGGHWLKTLRGLGEARIWWAETDAPQEYEDALLAAFADDVPAAEAAALHDPTVVLPFANLQTVVGERKAHGIGGSLLVGEESPPSAIRRSVTTGGRAGSAGRGGTRATGGAARATGATGRATPAGGATGAAAGGGSSTRAADGATRAGRSTRTPIAQPPAPERTKLTAAGLDRLEAELAELREVQRPAIVARIKAARELGDLRENADYEAARREQSFVEGRVQAVEAILRNAHVVDEATTHEAIVGSVVVLEQDGETHRYTIVGSSEANPAEGRISYMSPLGSALLGRRTGDEIIVKAPSGDRRYRIADVR